MSVTSVVERELAEVYQMFPSCYHPLTEAVETELKCWFSETKWGSWRAAAETVAKHRIGELAALAFPKAADPLPLAKLLAWVTVLDDIVETSAFGEDLGVQAVLGSLLADSAPESWKDEPQVRALADLWPALTKKMAPHWEKRLRSHVADCIQVETRWTKNRRIGAAPSLAAYINGRRQDGAFITGLDLVERQFDAAIPAAVFRHDLLKKFLAVTMDIIVWTNDLLSADRELSINDVINLIPVLEGEGFSRSNAVHHALSMLRERTQSFFEIGEELNAVCRANSRHAIDIDRWIIGMQHTIRGLYDWSAGTRRYQEKSAFGFDVTRSSILFECSDTASPYVMPTVESNLRDLQFRDYISPARRIEITQPAA